MDPGLQFVFMVVGLLTCSAGVIWAVVAILKPLINYLVTRKQSKIDAARAAAARSIGLALQNSLDIFDQIPNAVLVLRIVGESLQTRGRIDCPDLYSRVKRDFPNYVDVTEGSAA